LSRCIRKGFHATRFKAMSQTTILTADSVAVHVLIQITLVVRVLLRPHRDPASRIAWVLVVASMPVLGILAYLLLGEVRLGRRRVQRMRAAMAHLPRLTDTQSPDVEDLGHRVPQHYLHLFRVGQSISGFPPIGGNSGCLMQDSDATIDTMVADIDAARDHVHLLFYIWLPDNNGRKVAAALNRAARRGVACRAMADDLGSRLMIRSEHWRAMGESGVRLARALPIGNPLLRVLRGRIDLRNHRKIVVIDDRITYCGSQNCADPGFLVKAKYAPWVDAVIRFEGPITRQSQHLFAADWMAHTGEDLTALLLRPIEAVGPGFPAQAFGTGPTVRYSAMPEIFQSLVYSARRELVVTTPYYVPDDPLQAALCASARRGVSTTMVFPARNDSWVVATASRSYYADLLSAGVRIFEYPGGLLHTKSLTLDGEVTLIGSANMDRRSFDLNYENNILFVDPRLTADVRRRQQDYIAQSVAVSAEAVESSSWRFRLRNNAVAMLGPIL
jgi:cardiolipin synthase